MRSGTAQRIRGVALISVLLVAAILAAIVHRVTAQHSLNLAQSQNSIGYDQALAYALGGEALARQILHDDFEDDKEEEPGEIIDSLDEPWAQAVPPLEMDGVGFIEIQAKDLNGCFNLNAIADLGAEGGGLGGTAPEAGGEDEEDRNGGGETEVDNEQEDSQGVGDDPQDLDPTVSMDPKKRLALRRQQLDRFTNLLRNLQIPEPEPIANALWDWMDADQEVRTDSIGAGAEDADYLGMNPAYRTADQGLAHISELRLLRGMTPEYMELLAPHVCVLPTAALRLNVNTSNGQALAALVPNLDEFRLLSLMDWMETERPFEKVEQFTAVENNPNPIAEFAQLKGFLDVKSEYFEVQVRVQVGQSIAVLTSVLRRNPKNGGIELMSRDMGRNFLSQFAAETEEG